MSHNYQHLYKDDSSHTGVMSTLIVCMCVSAAHLKVKYLCKRGKLKVCACFCVSKARHKICVRLCLSEKAKVCKCVVCVSALVHLLCSRQLLLSAWMYVNTSELTVTILGTYFTINNGVTCGKNNLAYANNYTMQPCQ